MGGNRQTIVVEGLLSYRMERAHAARAGAVGREILTVPQLAARLAGGFLSLAASDILYPAISEALAAGGFADLNAVADLPGMPRAVAATLNALWASDLDVDNLTSSRPRLSDIKLLMDRVRATLPSVWLTPRDLRDAAMARLHLAPTIFGTIQLTGVCYVDPVWKPLIEALCRETDVSWIAPEGVDAGWFTGKLVRLGPTSRSSAEAYSCADPTSEVVESLRWVRQHLSIPGATARDIAISAASTAQYDEQFLVLREQSLPIHFAHGIPALSTSEGQACAALADLLIRGLDQDRVRRLVRLWPTTPTSALLPPDWSAGLHAEAILLTSDHWAAALKKSSTSRTSGDAAERALLPVLRLIEQGPSAAGELGELLLRGESLAIWKRALRSAPPAALPLSLQQLRLPDPWRDAADSVVWCQSDDLAASPRRIVRLLGLTVGSWPRQERDDPLVPAHVLDRSLISHTSVTARDRTAFSVIASQADELVLTMARRNTKGGLQSPSPLWPKANVLELARLRVPESALDETDRLLARPEDAKSDPRVIRTRKTWRDWQSSELTPADGLLPERHPTILKALGRTNSPTSLRLMLRDPQAYVWARAFGWRARSLERLPLSLDARSFGELVHELLAVAVRDLDAAGGVQTSSHLEREQAIARAAEAISEQWPLERPVPPGLLWTAALDVAGQLALTAIEADDGGPQRVRSWTELGFGDFEESSGPWTNEVVKIPGTAIEVHGRIDRLDLADNRSAVRITDYKTSRLGGSQRSAVLDGGRELQRVLYAVAARQLLPDVPRVVARLMFLRDEGHSETLAGDPLDGAIASLATFASAAQACLQRGISLPGPDAEETYSRYRIARPADLQRYLSHKADAIERVQTGLRAGWSLP